jgi:purine-binding chemotaxis protein CheW
MSSLHVWVQIAGEDYAVPVDDVLEVADLGDVIPIPGAPAAVLGVRNLRGTVLPVVDLAAVFELARDGVPERIVVVEDGGRSAGLAVDSVVGVEQLPACSEEVVSPHLVGATLAAGALVGVVDVRSVLDAASGAAVR